MPRSLALFLACALLAPAAARAATVAELEAKVKTALEFAAKEGHVKIEPKAPEKPYEPTEAEQKQGFVVWFPPIQERFTGGIPAADHVPGSAKLTLAKGETGSLLVAVYALRDLKNLSLRRKTEEQPKDDRENIEILPLVQAPISTRKRVRNTGNMDAEQAKPEYRVEGFWLADSGRFDIPKGEARAFLFRASAEAKTEKLSLAEGDKGIADVEIALAKRDFTLVDPWERKYVFGAFCAGANFTEAEFKQMKAHGIEAIQWFWGHHAMDLKKENDKLVVDFTELDRVVDAFTKAGMRGPIVLALGNDSAGHYEKKICQLFERPMQPQVKRDKKEVKLATLDDKVTEGLIVDGLKQLFAHAEEKKYPEIVVMPYDEPTERLMDEHRRMVKLFREHFPKVRLYGCTMDELNLAEQLTDTDILVSNGDFKRIRALTKSKKMSSWFYGGVTGAQGYAAARVKFGFAPYCFGPDGMWFWCYNYVQADPYNDFDGTIPDSAWIQVWPPLSKGGPGTECISFEGVRAAVNDLRYGLTLDALLEKAPENDETTRIKGEFAVLKANMEDRKTFGYRQVLEAREKIAGWIGALTKKE
ncbi:MAG: hypothetical protein L6R28_21305 [Planctomycetes bacterium]|nr:hypothetical protein [Planctomycetota bacterium]